MNDTLELALRTVLVGAGATLTMDGWAFLLRRIGIPSLDLALLGRWLGHLRRGRWKHESIARAAPVRGELLLGWCAHYAIGITFAALLLSTFGLGWARSPSPTPALFIGIATAVAPLFILQPALGAGIASSKTSAPVRNSLKSLLTHTVFGVGLYLSALATTLMLPGAK
jgi:hypothetical protein